MTGINIIVHVDGSCMPNNPGGIATGGASISKNGVVVHEIALFVAKGSGASNNVGEYGGLNAALEWLMASNMQCEQIEVRADSKLVINQMSGAWRCHDGLYVDQHDKAVAIARHFPKIKYRWVPREHNAIADALCRKAYDDYCKSRNVDAVCPDQQPAKVPATSKPGITCMTCKWLKEKGPHVGCFLNNKYQKWLSKPAASSSACEHHRGWK